MSISDLSVIIRGLVVGMNEKDPKKQFTRRSIESVRKHFPNSKIILSTWENSNVSDLYCDEIILSHPPESIFMIKEDGTKKFMSINNQIVSTNAGLEMVQTPYVISMRSDMVINNISFIKYFLKYNQKNAFSYFEKKILVLPTYNPRRISTFLFNVCDWFYFGLTKDVKNFFNIPLMNESDFLGEKKEGLYLIEENFEAEQYSWIKFLKKYQDISIKTPQFFSKEFMNDSEKSYAQNLIMVPAQKAGVVCLKMPGGGYGAKPMLSQGLYTFNEYKKMCNTYCKTTYFIIPNLFEIIFYPIVLKTRFFLKKKTPFFYKFFINTIRKLRGCDQRIQ